MKNNTLRERVKNCKYYLWNFTPHEVIGVGFLMRLVNGIEDKIKEREYKIISSGRY